MWPVDGVGGIGVHRDGSHCTMMMMVVVVVVVVVVVALLAKEWVNGMIR